MDARPGILLLAAACALLTGCKAVPQNMGSGRSVQASYLRRTLTADVPATVRVPAAVAAADAALRDRGYAVTDSTATEDVGRVAAEPRDAGFLDAVVVDVRVTGSGTRIEVTVRPIGNRAQSRAILDSILSRLGL